MTLKTRAKSAAGTFLVVVLLLIFMAIVAVCPKAAAWAEWD